MKIEIAVLVTTEEVVREVYTRVAYYHRLPVDKALLADMVEDVKRLIENRLETQRDEIRN